MAGMDRAVVIASAVMFAAALIALFTIKDRVVNAVVPVPVEEDEVYAIGAEAAD